MTIRPNCFSARVRVEDAPNSGTASGKAAVVCSSYQDPVPGELIAMYRLQQGLRALATWLRPVDDARAARLLSPGLFALYRQMRRSERQHSLRVLNALQRSGHTDPDLLAAALLHDVGKIRCPFTLPEKVLVVLVKAARPRLYARLGNSPAHGWRRPFAVSVQHPAWGAEMVAVAGGSPLLVELVRRHADSTVAPDELADPVAPDTNALLSALQQADDRN